MEELEILEKTIFPANEERRAYPRLGCDIPLKYRICRQELIGEPQIATVKNISPSGLLLKTDRAMPVSALVLLESKLAPFSEQLKRDKEMLEINGKYLGKVIRTLKDKRSGIFEVGIQFINAEDELREDVAETLALVKN